MSNYGMPQFNAGFGRPVYLPPPPPAPPQPPAGGSSRPFLMMLMFIACLLVGVLLAWGLRERGERNRLFQRNGELENAYVSVLAKRSDLVSFLTDAKTRLYRLSGHGEASGRRVTVAWQEETHTAVLLGEGMPLPPDETSYTLWHVDGAHVSRKIGSFRPEPAGTFYKSRLESAEKETAGFQVTIEKSASPVKPGQIAYETD